MPDASQLKMDTKTTLKASDIQVHDFTLDAITARGGVDDILERVNRAARQAAETKPPAAFKVGAVDVDFDGLRANLGDEGPEAEPLREAKRLVNQQQFEAALTKLAEVIVIDPHHHEATYLQAFCHFKLSKVKLALETLLKLKDAALSNRLQTRVRSLQEEIRQQTLAKASQIYVAAVKSKEVDKATGQLRQFVETDPEVGKFHYFLSGVLVVGKKMQEARTAAAHGLDVCTTDREELQQFLQEIDRRFLPESLGPAREAFRKKDYPAAGRALANVPPEIRATTLCQTFQGYVDKLTGKGGGLFSRLLAGSLTTADPPGTPDAVRELYEFLVERELKAARAAVKENDYPKAERALAAAIAFTPSFALPNHMLATCVYQRVGSTVKEKIGKDLDEEGARQLRHCQDELKNVRQHAVIGTNDATITDAPRLLKSIDEMLKQIDDVVGKYEIQLHDAKLVNQAVDNFIQMLVGIMLLNAATDRYSILRQAEDLYSRLDSMRSSLPVLRRQCKGNQARELIDMLKNNFVEPNFQTLRKLMGR